MDLKQSQIANVLVVGASGGIGLALVKQLLADVNIRQIHGTFRRSSLPQELEQLVRQSNKRLRLHQLDLTDEVSIGAVSDAVGADTERLDTIINAAGLLHDANVMPERRLDSVSAESLIANFQVNAIGPVLIAKHFARFLPRRERAVLANLSARVGSTSDNHLGGWYSYRASKAAQNMLTRNLAIELARRHHKLICVALHPGTVATALSSPFQANVPAGQLFTTQRAATQLLQVLRNLTPQDNGKFFAWDGQVIPW